MARRRRRRRLLLLLLLPNAGREFSTTDAVGTRLHPLVAEGHAARYRRMDRKKVVRMEAGLSIGTRARRRATR